MSKTTTARTCACASCTGPGCRCGCQEPVIARRAGCGCGEACRCGTDCTCAKA